MKKSVVALALASAFSGAAYADSAINIYGIVDMGLVRETGGTAGAVNKLTSGAQSGTRLGFKGTEDLGDNLKALFVLETGIAADAGGFNQTNTAFARQSFVGLQNDWGTLTMGRQYTAYFLTLSQVADPFAAGMAGASQNLMLPLAAVEPDRAIRMNNAVKYASPVFNNFSGELAYGFGEVAGVNGGSSVVSGSVGYSMDPVNVRLAYYRKNNAADTDNLSSVMLAANWDFKVAKLFAAYADNDALANGKTRDVLIGATVPFGKHTFIASYINKDDRGTLNQDANQAALGYTYELSKRTNFYAAWARIDNKRGATYKVGNNSEPGSGDKAFNLGIRHIF